MNRITLWAFIALVVAMFMATAWAWAEPVDNIALPVERRTRLQTSLTLNGMEYACRVDHVRYDPDTLTVVYIDPTGGVSEPLRQRDVNYAIEVYLRPTGDPEAQEWVVFRTSASPFEPQLAAGGFLIAPSVVGVGVWRRADGDRLLVADWKMSDLSSYCYLFAVESEHRMTPIPMELIIDRRTRPSTRIPTGPMFFTAGEDRDEPIYAAYITMLPMGRAFFIDPDSRLHLTGEADEIRVVRGAWGQRHAGTTLTTRVRKNNEYVIETHEYNTRTDDAEVREPTPIERALFADLELTGPPQPLDRRTLPGHDHR